MIFPPPPGLAFLAYIYGSISKDEYLDLVKLWRERHDTDRDGDTVS
jgi:hypothetical protein